MSCKKDTEGLLSLKHLSVEMHGKCQLSGPGRSCSLGLTGRPYDSVMFAISEQRSAASDHRARLSEWVKGKRFARTGIRLDLRLVFLEDTVFRPESR